LHRLSHQGVVDDDVRAHALAAAGVDP
jgi:hypothetical protein